MKLNLFRKYDISAKATKNIEEANEIFIGLHGFAGDQESSVLIEVGNLLNSQGKGLITFDLPGHGVSKVTDDEFTIDNCLEDVKFIIKYIEEKYEDKKISIFATSFGAYLTILLLQEKNILNRLNNVVLRCPAFNMKKILVDEILKEDLKLFKEKGFTIVGYERELELKYEFYESLTDLTDVKVDKEVLIIHGNKDTTAPIKNSYVFSKANNSILKIVDGADHRFKNPGEIEEIIKCFDDYVNRDF